MKGEIYLSTESLCKVLVSVELPSLLPIGKYMHEAKKPCSAYIFFQIGLRGGSRYPHTKDKKRKYMLKLLCGGTVSQPLGSPLSYDPVSHSHKLHLSYAKC